MINKCISASGYNVDGSALSKLGGAGRANFLNRGSVVGSFSATSRVFNQDFAPTGWHFNQELNNYNDYLFKASTFGCALSQVSFLNDAGVSQITINGHATGTYHTMLPGETLTIDGFITTIWGNNLAASGTSILRAVGIPVTDITKMP